MNCFFIDFDSVDDSSLILAMLLSLASIFLKLDFAIYLPKYDLIDSMLKFYLYSTYYGLLCKELLFLFDMCDHFWFLTARFCCYERGLTIFDILNISLDKSFKVKSCLTSKS